MGESSSPDDPPMEICNVTESSEEVRYTEVIHTPKGELTAERFIRRRSPTSNLSNYVKNPEDDSEKVLELLKNPDSKCLEEIRVVYEEIGDQLLEHKYILVARWRLFGTKWG